MAQNIAITVQESSGFEAALDPRFGRAFAFLITDGDLFEVVPNGERDVGHGAGTGAASRMSLYAVDVVISGRFGPKAQAALAAMGIEMWTAPTGLSAREALDAFKRGKLTRWA